MALYQGSFSVFSTYVEMIPFSLGFPIANWRILHVCGDDPMRLYLSKHDIFVFSTYVEMILSAYPLGQSTMSILHVCGDDPAFEDRINDFIKYSPRMWSCF